MARREADVQTARVVSSVGGNTITGEVVLGMMVRNLPGWGLLALLMVSELLLINQIPDAEADRAIGRRHLVITLGPEKAAHLVAGLLLASYGVIVAGVISGHLDMTGLIALAPLPAAIWISLRLPRVLAMPDQLNRVLGANVAVLLSTLALLVTGLSL